MSRMVPLAWLVGVLALMFFVFIAFSRGLYASLLTLELLTITVVLMLALRSYEIK